MSLRRVIKRATGQNINICHACFDCDIPLAEEMDIPLGSLVQLVLLDDSFRLINQKSRLKCNFIR